MLLCCLGLAVCIASQKAHAQSKLSANLSALAAAGDDLGIRILLRGQFTRELSEQDWRTARTVLANRPGAGFDLIAAWDRHPSWKGRTEPMATRRVEKTLERADSLMSERKFQEAFRAYQTVARFLRKQSPGGVRRSNVQFYYSVLHSMARALYGAGRVGEAIQVYDWIPASYFQIQQVLFEKMWAGFRSKRYDTALGAIASQRSGYFSEWLEPEAYLVQIYILKRLCRQEQAEVALSSLRRHFKAVSDGSLTAGEWARRDLYWSSLALLVERRGSKAERLDIVSATARDQEIARVQKKLDRQFAANLPRLRESLRLVLGYSTLAVRNPKPLGKVSDLEDPRVLRKKGVEWWPAKDGEEWLDEIGSHVFVGESLCNEKP